MEAKKNMLTVGEIIKNWRKKKGFTQYRLALALRVTEVTISNWENNKRLPDQNLIIDKLQEIIPELKGHKDLRGGSVFGRLTESVGKGKEDPLAGLYWRAMILANEFPDRVSVETTRKENVIRLKVK